MRLRNYFSYFTSRPIIPEECQENSAARKRIRHCSQIIEEEDRSEPRFSVLIKTKVILEKQYVGNFPWIFYGKKFNVHVLQLNFYGPSFQVFCIPSGNFRQFQQLVNICTTGKIPLADQVSAKRLSQFLCAKPYSAF